MARTIALADNGELDPSFIVPGRRDEFPGFNAQRVARARVA